MVANYSGLRSVLTKQSKQLWVIKEKKKKQLKGYSLVGFPVGSAVKNLPRMQEMGV